MAFKGPNVPHRTARSIALAKGTSSGGFAGGIEYCGECGCPTAACKGHYKDPADIQANSRPSNGAAKSFKLGG